MPRVAVVIDGHERAIELFQDTGGWPVDRRGVYFAMIEEFEIGDCNRTPVVGFVEDQATAFLDDALGHRAVDLGIFEQDEVWMFPMAVRGDSLLLGQGRERSAVAKIFDDFEGQCQSICDLVMIWVHGPRGTSGYSTNCQSTVSMSVSPR